MDVDDIVAALRGLLESDDRVDAAFVFGSTARRQLREHSDVDVAIRYRDDLDGDRARVHLEILGRLGRTVPRDIHLVDLDQAGPDLRRRVYAQGIVLADRDPRRTRDDHVRASMQVLDWEYARKLRGAAIERALSRDRSDHG